MLLIEEKSLSEVYLLYQLSFHRDNPLYRWHLELNIDIVRKLKDICDSFNEFNIVYPYGL